MAGLLDIDLADVEFMKMDQEFPADPDLSFHLFPDLPYELRLEIIEEWLRSQGDTYWSPGDLRVVRTYGAYRQTSRLRNPLAKYATINKQWKFAVEKHTFRSLTFAVPEFGRKPSLDRGNSFFRSSGLLAYDDPDALDKFERICIEERINAVLKIDISLNLHNGLGRPRPWSSLNTMFSAAGHGDDTDPEIIEVKQLARAAFEKVLKALERFQESKLQSLDLGSEVDGLRMADPMSPTHSSLNLSQSLYAMTCRLERLTLCRVVNAPYFLKESWAAKGSKPESPPAWPKLKFLTMRDCFNPDFASLTSVAAELHDAVTSALPQMPNLILLSLAIVVPACILTTLSGDRNIPRRLQHTSVHIVTCQHCDTFETRLPEVHLFSDRPRRGRLILTGPAPAPETIDLWRQIARRQWDCDLRVREEYDGFTYWRGS